MVVTVSPTSRLPAATGATVFVGADGAAEISPMWFEFAVTPAASFVAVTTHRMLQPRSPVTFVYVEAVCPARFE